MIICMYLMPPPSIARTTGIDYIQLNPFLKLPLILSLSILSLKVRLRMPQSVTTHDIRAINSLVLVLSCLY